ILWSAAACGSISNPKSDPGVGHDAGIDEPPLREARELVNGAARMTGTTYTFDLQIGHAVQQGKAAGATYQLESNAAVKP
ncbi:MAG TPA: hypothetical protein VHT91_31495, partial [Kofleriaceae bacterium]|nr:hypothetical protein [Kofleriaceae bacterium]